MAADPNAAIDIGVRAGMKSPAHYRARWDIPLNENWARLDTYAAFLDVASTWTAEQTFNGTLTTDSVQASELHADNLFLTGAGGLSLDNGTTTIANLLAGSGALTFGSINAGAQNTQNVVVTGADTSFIVIATPGGSIGAAFVWNAQITSGGICGVTVTNISAAPATPSVVTWRVIAFELA